MEARSVRVVLILLALGSLGAVYRTPNFVVQAPSAEVAKQVALTAEQSRKQIARDWLGRTLPQWYNPCRVTVETGRIGAGGATTFQFDRGEVFGWRMRVQGSLERILDSVIPHEVSHTIFACHFRRPLPRWADEGAATLVEHESEQHRQRLLLNQVLNTRQKIPLRRLLAMTEYPGSSQQMLVLYAQGYSLADFLVQTGGKARYLQFLQDAHRHSWESAIRRHYRFESIEQLDKTWSGWVTAGSPRLNLPEGTQLADAGQSRSGSPKSPDPSLVIRSQSPEASKSGADAPRLADAAKQQKRQAEPLNNNDSDEPQPGSEWLASVGDQRSDDPNPIEDGRPIPLPRTLDDSTQTAVEHLPRERLTRPLLTVPYRRAQQNPGEPQPRPPGHSTDTAGPTGLRSGRCPPRTRPAKGPRPVLPDPAPGGAGRFGSSLARSLFPQRFD